MPITSYNLLFMSIFIFISLSCRADALNNLVISNYSIEEPLSEVTPDIALGQQLVTDVNKGNCLACHQIPQLQEDMQGTLGPPLEAIGNRLTQADLRLRIVNMKKLNPFSIMPAYYRSNSELNRVAERYSQSTILSADEVEHVIAYLSTLKQ